jgi:hypothetical protein
MCCFEPHSFFFHRFIVHTRLFYFQLQEIDAVCLMSSCFLNLHCTPDHEHHNAKFKGSTKSRSTALAFITINNITTQHSQNIKQICNIFTYKSPHTNYHTSAVTHQSPNQSHTCIRANQSHRTSITPEISQTTSYRSNLIAAYYHVWVPEKYEPPQKCLANADRVQEIGISASDIPHSGGL